MCRRTRCWRSGRDRVAIEELPRRRRAARRRSSSCRGCQAFVGEPLPPWPHLRLMIVSRERAGLNDGVPDSRAEHVARRSDQRGQGPRPGPVPRAPRGLLHPGALDGRGGRERVGRCEHRTPRPPSHAHSGPALSPHRSRRSPCPHCTDPLMPQRRTRPARPLVGLTSSSAAPSAATVEVAAAAAADELVGPKRRRATTLTRLLPTYAGVNATRERARPPPPPSRPPPPPLSLPTVARRHSRHRHCCRHPRSHLRRHCRRCRA